METFVASKTERHPTDLAMLRGARAVMAQETEQGQRWAESRIKALTGGDAISARFMRQDFFTFEPAFKLMIAGNHKPSLRNVDEAVRRRFNLVPFTVTIPKSERDPDLPQKLEAEWPGILVWAIQGCLEWQRIGLAPPPAVLDATEGYLADEDAIGRFLDERCETGDMLAMEEVKELFASWRDWCNATASMPARPSASARTWRPAASSASSIRAIAAPASPGSGSSCAARPTGATSMPPEPRREGIEGMLPYQAFRARARARTCHMDGPLRSLRTGIVAGMVASDLHTLAMIGSAAVPPGPIRMRGSLARCLASVRARSG
jgi:hypothetical protein